MLKLTIIGNLGSDATVKPIKGKNVINFSVCHTEKWIDAKGVKQERQHWVDCAQWLGEGKESRLPEFLKKGQQVYVEGLPTVDIYDKADGTKGVTQRLRVDKIELLGSRKKEGEGNTATGANGGATGAAAGGTAGANIDDDLPF